MNIVIPGYQPVLCKKEFVALLTLCLALMGCSDSDTALRQEPVVPVELSMKASDRETSSKPNVLVIVADDLGYADIEAFGGEIKTPSIDALAKKGVQLNRFYTSLTCSPTRAMLLTGVDNHLAGLGNMAEFTAPNQLGKPGYEGYLNDRVATIAEILRDEGYHTYMAGKWHLGLEHHQSARARGFERAFSSLFGASSHFDDRVGPDAYRPKALYRLNGELHQAALSKDFYSTKDYTQFLIDSIEEQRDDGRPFFGYLAYTAPHWPLQAPRDYIEKYAGQFTMGWDVLRVQRFEKAKLLGLIPQQASLPDRPDGIPAWNSLSPQDQTLYARYMEIYAAMVDYMDEEIGRLTRYLKQKGLYKNTLIVFMSDNGADALRVPAIIEFADTFDNSLESAGSKGSFVLYGPPWAFAGSAYLNRFKGTAYEGGVRVPAFVSYPPLNSAAMQSSEMATVLDIVPTILDATGIQHPSAHSRQLYAPQGRSLMPALRGDSFGDPNLEAEFGIEMWSKKAFIKGDWKLLEVVDAEGERRWKLFDVVSDPGETSDLSQQYPAKYAELQALWASYVSNNGLQINNEPLVVLPAGPLPTH